MRAGRYMTFAFGVSIILAGAAAEGPLWLVVLATGAHVFNAYMAATDRKSS